LDHLCLDLVSDDDLEREFDKEMESHNSDEIKNMRKKSDTKESHKKDKIPQIDLDLRRRKYFAPLFADPPPPSSSHSFTSVSSQITTNNTQPGM
jgi:hypothetical protein